MIYKNIAIYGGSSEISVELVEQYINQSETIFIFCRNKDFVLKKIFNKDSFKDEYKKKIEFIECNLLNYKNILQIINDQIKVLSGLIWVAGFTGDSEKEYNDFNLLEKNLLINFTYPTILINEFSKKLIKNKNSFIAVVTSVAGLRGRNTQLFYSPSKAGLITYLSGLRQKLYTQQVHVCTIIPGYINTTTFKKENRNSPNILITTPKKCAQLIYRGIKNKKEIIYIGFLWRVIMFIISLIPEKIFKRLKF